MYLIEDIGILFLYFIFSYTYARHLSRRFLEGAYLTDFLSELFMVHIRKEIEQPSNERLKQKLAYATEEIKALIMDEVDTEKRDILNQLKKLEKKLANPQK